MIMIPVTIFFVWLPSTEGKRRIEKNIMRSVWIWNLRELHFTGKKQTNCKIYMDKKMKK